MQHLSGGIANVCSGIVKSIFGMPQVNLGIAKFKCSWLTLKGGIVKIFLAQLIFKIGMLTASIHSGIESQKS